MENFDVNELDNESLFEVLSALEGLNDSLDVIEGELENEKND